MALIVITPEKDVNKVIQDEYQTVLKRRQERKTLDDTDKLTVFAHVTFEDTSLAPYLFTLNYDVSDIDKLDNHTIAEELLRLGFDNEFLTEITSPDKVERTYALGDIIANIVTQAVNDDIDETEALNNSAKCASIVKRLMQDVSLINMRIEVSGNDMYHLSFHAYTSEDPYPSVFIPIEMETDPTEKPRLN